MRGTRAVVAAVAGVTATACSAGGVVVAAARQPRPLRLERVTAAPSRPSAPLARPSAVPARAVTVAGRSVPASRAHDVAAALSAAHVVVPTGRVVALVSGRPLGSDHLPGHVLVNGRPAPLTAGVDAGDVVTVVAGPDRTEPTRSETVTVSPPNPSNLYVGGTAGRARARVGVRSGEVAVGQLVVAPTLGHLVTPGAVALTFDDGPDPTWTPRVLALLARAQVHATFCLIGSNAARYPQLVRNIASAGHTLCDHTWDHDEQLPLRAAHAIRVDIARCAAAIRAASGGIRPRFFRAPGGNWSAAVETEARHQHMIPLKWTVDPRDWSRPGVAAILATVYSELRPGGVILMHDGGGDRSQSIAALRVLLNKLPKMGYHFIVPPAG